MSSSTGPTEVGNSSEGGATAHVADALHREAETNTNTNTISRVNASTQGDEGECSDSDALLPSMKPPLSPDISCSVGSTARGRRNLFAAEGEACSPLLLSTENTTPIDIPSLNHAMSPSAMTDDESAGSTHSQSRATKNNNQETTAPPLPTAPNQQSSPIENNMDSTIFQHPPAYPAAQPFSSPTTPTEQVFLPTSILQQHNPPPSFLHHSAPPTPSVSSSHSNSSSSGLGGIRRFVRSRATARTLTTAADSSVSQHSTQSLGDEDLFALTLNGEDPRLPTESNNALPPFPVEQQPQTQRALWDAARMHSSGNLPPIVWEESSDSDPETREQQRARRRTFSEPSANRLRGFLSPIPGVVRRRGQRQSRSVRRHLPRSSSTPTANMLATSPLSTTAQAVLFSSTQASQASIDSFQEYALSPNRLSGGRSRQQQQSRQLGASSNSNNQLRMSSHSLDDSARAGVGTIATSHRSLVMDGTGESISTIGNSTVPVESVSPSRQSQRAPSSGNALAGAHLRDPNLDDSAIEVEVNTANGTDPNREARVRWVRINQRFQLMITFVAICFSLLLFSILISWIVLTSAYVVTFEKDCDIPLKFFYWLVTLQLILDVFRNDIMRFVLRYDPNAHPPDSGHQFIPARVVAYNIAYLAYALLVLRMGIDCVYITGRAPESTCRNTAPELFQSSVVFVTLTLAAWATIILGYLLPFCVVATMLTLNGYNPGDAEDGARGPPIPGGVFPSAYSTNGAPPGTIEQLREIDLDECGEQECCICMEDFRTGRHHADDAIVQTDCGHILHKNCCSVWLRQARTCPVCRTDIPNAQAERLRQEQAELGQDDSNQNTQQQQGQESHLPSPVPLPAHHRTPVAPHLPFRPAGRQEVATLIRALRQPRRERPRSGRRTANGSHRSNQSAGSTGSNQIDRSRNEEPSPNIEITSLSRRGESTSTLHTNEGNRSNGHPTNGGNDSGEAQFVL